MSIYSTITYKGKEKIIARGVVFNEMKGAMSSPMEIMYRRTLNSVFPSITYHHNSGGEPVDILDLDLAQLQEFHKTHYHPSNAKFFSYGSFLSVAIWEFWGMVAFAFCATFCWI